MVAERSCWKTCGTIPATDSSAFTQVVISTLAGRNQPSDKPLVEIYPLTLEFHERFAKEFGSCACGDLMPYEFNTREHLKNCLKLVNKVAQLLAVYLEEKELLK